MNKKAKNLPAFKALIERYETITIEEIEDEIKKHERLYDAKTALTGLGRMNTCSLCVALNKWEDNIFKQCSRCVYGGITGCVDHKSYTAIVRAKTPTSILSAYRARAKYMRSLLEETK